MTRHQSRPIPTRLDQLRKQFAQWRRSRRSRGRIPDALWTSAANVASQHGVSFTARALGLNADSLKKRVQSSVATVPSAAPDATFIEVMSPGFVRECTVELEDAQGSKMRVVVKGDSAPDVSTLIDRFWQIDS